MKGRVVTLDESAARVDQKSIAVEVQIPRTGQKSARPAFSHQESGTFNGNVRSDTRLLNDTRREICLNVLNARARARLFGIHPALFGRGVITRPAGEGLAKLIRETHGAGLKTHRVDVGNVIADDVQPSAVRLKPGDRAIKSVRTQCLLLSYKMMWCQHVVHRYP